LDGSPWLRFDAPYEVYTHYGQSSILTKAIYVAEGRSRIRKLVFNTAGHVKQAHMQRFPTLIHDFLTLM